MVAGLRIQNSSGTIQIDENYANLVLVKKATATVKEIDYGYPAGDKVRYFNPTYSGGSSPMIAFGGNHFFGVRDVTVNGNDYTWHAITDAPVNSSVTYYVFDTQPQSHSSRYGLIVRDASNRITFSSDWKPLRVVDARYEKVPNRATGQTRTRTYPSGRTYAVIWGQVSQEMITLFGNTWGHFYGSIAKFSGNQLTISSGLYYVFNVSGQIQGAYGDDNINYIVIDVTHY